jgi:hypothetical protein
MDPSQEGEVREAVHLAADRLQPAGFGWRVEASDLHHQFFEFTLGMASKHRSASADSDPNVKSVQISGSQLGFHKKHRRSEAASVLKEFLIFRNPCTIL